MEFSSGIVTLNFNKLDRSKYPKFISDVESEKVQFKLPDKILKNSKLTEGYLAYILAVGSSIENPSYYTGDKIRAKGIRLAQKTFRSFPAGLYPYNFKSISKDLLIQIFSEIDPKKYKAVNRYFNSLSKDPDFIVKYYHNMFLNNSLSMYLKDYSTPNDEVVLRLRNTGAFASWREQAKITSTTSLARNSPVVLSSDGNILVIGDQGFNNSKGSVKIYSRNESWTEQVRISSDNSSRRSWQGCSVALSSDGNTIAFGGPEDNNKGAVWVYIHSGDNNWVEQAKISSDNFLVESNQGESVALSSNGDILAFGSTDDNFQKGAVWIYIRSDNGRWIEQTKISADDSIYESKQGESIALSSNGNTLVFGGSGDNEKIGAVWVYIQLEDGTWIQQAKISSKNFTGKPNQGESVALSASGDTLAFGGSKDNGGIGAVWIYIRSDDGNWIEQAKISSSNFTDGPGQIRFSSCGIEQGPEQGYPVTLSADGNVLAFGGIGDDCSKGATWVYIRSRNGNWLEQDKISANSYEEKFQGTSIALSLNGNILAIADTPLNKNGGTVWIYSRE